MVALDARIMEGRYSKRIDLLLLSCILYILNLATRSNMHTGSEF
jgi:hypothetical protein